MNRQYRHQDRDQALVTDHSQSQSSRKPGQWHLPVANLAIQDFETRKHVKQRSFKAEHKKILGDQAFFQGERRLAEPSQTEVKQNRERHHQHPGGDSLPAWLLGKLRFGKDF